MISAGRLSALPRRRGGARRLLLRIAALVVAVAASAAVPATAPAASFGMSDGRPGLFDSADLHTINFEHVRLVLPWNAARERGSWNLWLERAQSHGFKILIAPSIDPARNCEGGRCEGPPVAEYRAALTELLAAYPGIESVEAWNEPNHGLQPTSRDAALAAKYFDAAAGACRNRCTAVAGNLLDGPSMAAYLRDYANALTTKPAVWGIHNYFDATYFQRSGLDQMLAITDGPVWLTEVGGLVTFRSSTGVLPYDEARAADSLRWLFTLAAREPRIERSYLYGMWEQKHNPFDSALIREDNSERPSLAVVRNYVGPRRRTLPGPAAWTVSGEARDGSAAAGGAAGSAGGGPVTAGALRLSGKRLAVGPSRRVSVAMRCVGGTPCTGRLRLVVGRWQYARGVTLAAGATKTVRVRLPVAAARRITRRPKARSWATLCSAGAVCGPSVRVRMVRR